MIAADWTALCLLVLGLGLRHGFDADHLSAIDGMTRGRAQTHPRAARLCGLWFSLGHGAVVILVALSVSALARRWTAPVWLESFGTLASVAVLVALGCANLGAVLKAGTREVVRPVGVRSRWLAGLSSPGRSASVALVGALFALSFDTLSQAVLFATSAQAYGGWPEALALGLLFTCGMLITDGLNGLWIARLLARAHGRALLASRVMGLMVAGASFLVAALATARWASSGVAAWSEGREMAFGAAVVGLMLAGFLASLWLTRASASAARARAASA